jgi:AcrR family transcriptional regulator
MSYIAQRRLEEKERRRADILDATEVVAADSGWDQMTMDQVARKARLSRALLYVYFRDKQDLLFGICERAFVVLGQRFAEAVTRHKSGIGQLNGLARAYVAFSQEFPLYFDVVSRCELLTLEPDGNTSAGLAVARGQECSQVIVTVLKAGMADGSIRADVGNPEVVAKVLYGFIHGAIQLATTKANVLLHAGVTTQALLEQALVMAARSVESKP